MKVAELIRQLEILVHAHGDLEIRIYDNGCGGHYNCEPSQGVAGVILHDGKIRIETTFD